MKSQLFRVLILSAATIIRAGAADLAALPFVSPIFGDHMVLQRGKPNTLWGWAAPGQVVRAEIAGQTARTVTGADGKWRLEIDPPAPGGPYTVKIEGAQTNELQDVLVGDVWLCGGQSNMELGLANSRNGAEEVRLANHPHLRFFKVERRVSYAPAVVPRGAWSVCSPHSVGQAGWGGFSAVAYFFGRKLEQDLQVPIGLIQDCLGGTPAESWMSADTLHKLSVFEPQLAELERLRGRGVEPYGSFLMHWLEDYDVGSKNPNWASAAAVDSDWKTVLIPGGFQELGVGEVPSVCWFRKTISLPSPLPSGKAILFLGSIEKMDTTYVNGRWVGASSWAENPRAYEVQQDMLKPGTNVVAVRVLKLKPQGGFLAKAEGLRLVLGDGTAIPLAGDWKGKLSVDARPPHPLPLDFENYPTMPAVLYRGMIEPLAPLALSGAIWYQGEANSQRAYQYRALLPAMIGDWRRLFGQGEFPFYIVSLPAFTPRRAEPGSDGWTELREAQALTARTVKNAALAVTVDTGDANDIHPKDKKVVGERLALCALANHYGKNVPFQGPTFASVDRLPGKLQIHFEHKDGRLVVKGDKLEEFSVAGKDRKWHWAEARIEGDAVVVSSAEVPEPEAARYAWQANPAATLYNGAGLPATPFRTDDWPGVTESAK